MFQAMASIRPLRRVGRNMPLKSSAGRSRLMVTKRSHAVGDGVAELVDGSSLRVGRCLGQDLAAPGPVLRLPVGAKAVHNRAITIGQYTNT